MSAVIDDHTPQRLRRRNLRLAWGVGVFAVAAYIGMYVIYLLALR